MQLTEDIRKLTDYQHVRAKTPVYLGSTTLHTQDVLVYRDDTPYIEEMSWVPAIYTSYREILDNAFDELSHGFGDKIEITYDKGVFSVYDNGRGIPLDWIVEESMHVATIVLSHARTGRNFGHRGEWAGSNGVGASSVNFASEWFKVEVWRDKKYFHQRFEESHDHVIHAPIVKKTTSKRTGTKVSFKLSDKVFADKTLPEEFLYSRIYELAATNPNIKIFYNGKKIEVKTSADRTLFTDYKHSVIEIGNGKFHTYFYLVPNFTGNGEFIYSLVNNIPAFNGGSHVDAFKRHFYSGLLKALENTSRRRKLSPNRNDISDGLLIFNTTRMEAPDFDAQSKTRLINEHVGKSIKEFFEGEDVFKSIITKNPEWIDAIYEHCAVRTQKKDDKDTKTKSRKILREKVPDLIDAVGKDRSKCILFIGEGDSAVSGITPVRTPETHGILALSGKILNVNGKPNTKVLGTKPLTMMMNSIGLHMGKKTIRSELNYGKIFIAHDADADGLNIGALIVNFFYTYWPELFDPTQEPVFYIFMTPYIISRKKGINKYWYAHNYSEFDPQNFNKANGWEITRAKGLAALREEDWIYCLKYPETYGILDDSKMTETLDLIFNEKRASDRKSWIGL